MSMKSLAGIDETLVGKVYLPCQINALYAVLDGLGIHYMVGDDKHTGISVIAKSDDSGLVEGVIETWREMNVSELSGMKLDHLIYLSKSGSITSEQLKEAVRSKAR